MKSELQKTNLYQSLELLIEHLEQGVLLESPDRKIVYINHAFLKMFGIPLDPEQLIGSDCSDTASQFSHLFDDGIYFLNTITKAIRSRLMQKHVVLKMKNGTVLSRDFIPLNENGIYKGHVWVYTDITKDENHKDTIYNQKVFYEEILNKIPADIAVFDHDHKYLYVNPNGIANDEIRNWIIGKTDWDYCHYRNKPLDLAKERHEHFVKAVENGAHYWEEAMNNGGKIETHMRSMSAVYNSANNVEMVIGYGLNVTAVKESEQALRKANRHLELLYKLMDSSSDSIQISRENGRLFYMNKQALTRLGICDSEMDQHFVWDFETEFKNEADWFEHVEKLKATEFHIVERVNLNKSTGKMIPVEVTVKYIQIENEGYIIANSRDISERYKNQKALESKQQMLKAISIATDELLSNNDLFSACAHSLELLGKATQVSRTYLFENSFNGNAVTSQRVEWSAEHAIPQIDNPELQNVPFELFEDILPQMNAGLPFNAHVDGLNDGQLKTILQAQSIQSILIIPITHKNKFWGFVGYDDCEFKRIWGEDELALLQSFAYSIANAIERKQLELNAFEAKEIAEKTNKNKSEFLANMSHEIRTPLNAFIGMARLLSKTKLDAKQLSYLTVINNSAESLLFIVNDILDIEKLNSGNPDFEKVEFNMEERLMKSLEMFMFRADEKNLKLKFLSECSYRRMVIGDPNRLSQVMNNLLNNAIKFTPYGSVVVRMTCKEVENEMFYSISVKDTGIGISKSNLQRIFEPYAQAGKGISGKYGGTGLGLSICKTIVEMQGGTISVDSTPGEGSEFIVNLRFEKSHNSNKNDKRDKNIMSNPDLSGLRVLIAEDVEINRFLIQHLLESSGCTVESAGNGKEALEMMSTNQFNCVLMDIQMPVMDGIEALKLIRQNNQFDGIPIIALTAHALIGDNSNFLKMGFDWCLTKPFTEDQLFEAIVETSRLGKAIRNDKPYDLKEMTQLSKNKPDFVKSMMTLFVEQSGLRVDEIKISLRSENLNDLKSTLHKLKPSLINFQVYEAIGLLKKIENNAIGGIMNSEVIEISNQIVMIVEKCIQFMKQELVELD
ncbi:MAG TPA: ATP-binding protein [Bacteroidia bacterium]